MGFASGPQPAHGRRGVVTVVWGLLVVLATVFGVLAGPKIIADQHELMCGGSPLWQGLANRLGDCSRYARQPAVVGSPTATGPQPRLMDYQKQLTDFRVAAHDGDANFLKHLSGAGFKLRNDDLCEAAKTLAAEKDFDRGRTEVEQLIVASLGSGKPCKAWPFLEVRPDHEMMSLQRFVLEVVFSGSGRWARNGCHWAEALARWPLAQSLIEKLNSAQGAAPEDLRHAARSFLAAIRRVMSTSRGSLVALCTKKRGSLWYEWPREEALLFLMSNTCADLQDFANMTERDCDAKIARSNHVPDFRPVVAKLEDWAR